MTDDHYEPTYASADDAVRAQRGSDVVRVGGRFGGLVAIGVMVALIISRVAVAVSEWKTWVLGPGHILSECFWWALITVLVVGGAALVGRLVGMFIAYANFWSAEPLRSNHPDDMEALVERLRTGQSPTVQRTAVRSAKLTGLPAIRRTVTGNAARPRLNPYVRWPIIGAVCAVGVYGSLLIAVISDQSGGALSGRLPAAEIIGSVILAGVLGVGFVVVGALAGLILRGFWDFLRSAAQPAHGIEPQRTAANAALADPFADRFQEVDSRGLAAIGSASDDESAVFVDPDEIEVVAEPRVAAVSPPASDANRAAPDITMHLRWAVLGAMVAAGVTLSALIATVAERNRVVTRAWSFDDVFRLVVSVIVFGGLAVAMGAGAGVVLRVMWDALGISNGRLKRLESATSDPAAADPFAERFGGGERVKSE